MLLLGGKTFLAQSYRQLVLLYGGIFSVSKQKQNHYNKGFFCVVRFILLNDDMMTEIIFLINTRQLVPASLCRL